MVVVDMTQAEWDAAVRRALDRLRLTYDQLADMAIRRNFNSLEAKKLWLAIGFAGDSACHNDHQ